MLRYIYTVASKVESSWQCLESYRGFPKIFQDAAGAPWLKLENFLNCSGFILNIDEGIAGYLYNIFDSCIIIKPSI
jgi:hypothetical protein